MGEEQKYVREGMPLDETLSPVMTAHEAEVAAIRERRIAREQAEIRHGFDNQPTAGHDRGRKR